MSPAGDDAGAEVFVEGRELGVGVGGVEFDAPALGGGEGEGGFGAAGSLGADLLAEADAGDGVEGGGEEVFFPDVEEGEGEVETVAEEGGLQADFELAAFLQGEIGVGEGEADELGDGFGGGAEGGVGVEIFGGGPDDAGAAGPGAVAFFEGVENDGGGGGGVGEIIAAEGDVVVAEAEDEFQRGGEFEDVLGEEGVSLDDDARGFLKTAAGPVPTSGWRRETPGSTVGTLPGVPPATVVLTTAS